MEEVCVDALKTPEEDYHNTKKLLRNIMMMNYIYITRKGKMSYEQQKEAANANCTVEELKKEAERLSMETFRGEGGLRDKIEWLYLGIKYVYVNLNRLRLYPRKGELYYNLINMRYIKGMPRQDVVSALNISGATYQRRMKEALEEMDNLLWGNLNNDTGNRILAAVDSIIK